MTERAGSTTPLDAFGTIDSMLPNGTVLALGEPTHGSANVSRWKFDVILDLARRGRLAALAFEESYAVGRDVDAALLRRRPRCARPLCVGLCNLDLADRSDP
jgi:erythromycin esterase-like protein